MKTNVILIGFGPVGQILLRHLLSRKELALVGIVDIDPGKRGKTVQDILPEVSCTTPISPDLDSIADKADVALLATASKLLAILPTLQACAKRKLHVVSTCEELIFPWKSQSERTKEIDHLAKEAGISILGTGINPGFLMDYLPIAMTAVCSRVESILVERIQNASTRRIPFQNKIGAGLTAKQFEEKLASGNFGHVGLTESAGMIAHAMRWNLTSEKEDIRPVLRPDGQTVAGIEQVFTGMEGNFERIRLHFRAAMDQPDPRDRIVIRGEPAIDSTIRGAVHGDIATVSIILNAAHRIQECRHGLVSMIDVPCVFVGV